MVGRKKNLLNTYYVPNTVLSFPLLTYDNNSERKLLLSPLFRGGNKKLEEAPGHIAMKGQHHDSDSSVTPLPSFIRTLYS